MSTEVEIDVAGEAIELFAGRAAHWRRRKTLIVADLHWGKSETLQKAGIPLPSQALDADLARLGRMVAATRAERVLILGDLVHARAGLTPEVVARVAAWREGLRELRIELITGNHDKRLRIPESWGIAEVGERVVEGVFAFEHGHGHGHVEEFGVSASGKGGWRGRKSAVPKLGEPEVTWSGHLHPSVTLRRGGDRLRMPCYLLQPRELLMPAFGSTTGTMDIVPTGAERVFVLAEDAVIEITRRGRA